MVCPKCGTEMEPGFLYCHECGEEINIVPDFEPEIENSISEILFNVADELATEESMTTSDDDNGKDECSEDFTQDSKRQKVDKMSARIIIGVGVTFVGIILIMAIVGSIIRVKYFSYDHQMDKAYECMQQGKYEQAIEFYNRALDINPKSSLARYYLGDAYMQRGDVENALIIFKEVAVSEGGVEERVSACQTVVDIYSQLGDYQAISDFLLDMGDNDVSNAFQKYKAKEPDFSYEEGSYEAIIPLKLTSNTAGTIYYTTDGSEPNDLSEVYNSPIFLENGIHTIKAYFVNEFDVASKVVVKNYIIDVSIPFAPEVSAYSGDYSVPTNIEVDVPEDSVVYYTTDGSEPNSDSTEYKQPIPMPIGKSRFKFVTYNDEGVAGEIVTRDYNLVLKTLVKVSDAESIITQGMLDIGKIYDLSGLSYDINGKYIYKLWYVTNIEDKGDFYIIAEYHEDTAGIVTRTGALYAVGVYDGSRYRLSLDEKSQYVFNEF